MGELSRLAKDIAAAAQNGHFNDSNADIVILSTGADPELFKVHKRNLAGFSPVFSDMLDLGSGISDATPAEGRHDRLPVVQLAETSATLEDFLLYAYHDKSRFANLNDYNWEHIISLWETCIKYGVALAQALLEEHILRQSVCLYYEAEADRTDFPASSGTAWSAVALATTSRNTGSISTPLLVACRPTSSSAGYQSG